MFIKISQNLVNTPLAKGHSDGGISPCPNGIPMGLGETLSRMKFAKIEKTIIIKKLGEMASADRGALKRKLANFFDL